MLSPKYEIRDNRQRVVNCSEKEGRDSASCRFFFKLTIAWPLPIPSHVNKETKKERERSIPFVFFLLFVRKDFLRGAKRNILRRLRQLDVLDSKMIIRVLRRCFLFDREFGFDDILAKTLAGDVRSFHRKFQRFRLRV